MSLLHQYDKQLDEIRLHSAIVIQIEQSLVIGSHPPVLIAVTAGGGLILNGDWLYDALVQRIDRRRNTSRCWREDCVFPNHFVVLRQSKTGHAHSLRTSQSQFQRTTVAKLIAPIRMPYEVNIVDASAISGVLAATSIGARG